MLFPRLPFLYLPCHLLRSLFDQGLRQQKQSLIPK